MIAYARMTRVTRSFGPRPAMRAFAMPDRTARLVTASVLALLAAFTVAYLVLMNAMTQKSFEIKRLSSRVTEQKRNVKRAEVDLAQKESMANLADRVSSLGMVPTGKLEYVTAAGGAVALR